MNTQHISDQPAFTDKQISGFILQVYRHSAIADDSQFLDWLLKKTQSLIDFDAAQWVEGRIDPIRGPLKHKTHLFNQPEEKTAAYHRYLEAHPGTDVIAPLLVKNPGKAITRDDTYEETDSPWETPYVRDYCRKYGQTHVLATGIAHRRGQLNSIVSLYRADMNHPFIPAEKQLAEIVVPHMVEAYLNCLRLQVFQHTLATEQKSLALVDIHGAIHVQSNNFAQAYEETTHRILDGEMMTDQVFLSLVQKEFVGYHKQSSMESSRLPNGCYLVVIHRDKHFRMLTSREDEVFRLNNQGLKYKEIAHALDISPNTVSQHLRNIREKMGVTSSKALIASQSDSN